MEIIQNMKPVQFTQAWSGYKLFWHSDGIPEIFFKTVTFEKKKISRLQN